MSPLSAGFVAVVVAGAGAGAVAVVAAPSSTTDVHDGSAPATSGGGTPDPGESRRRRRQWWRRLEEDWSRAVSGGGAASRTSDDDDDASRRPQQRQSRGIDERGMRRRRRARLPAADDDDRVDDAPPPYYACPANYSASPWYLPPDGGTVLLVPPTPTGKESSGGTLCTLARVTVTFAEDDAATHESGGGSEDGERGGGERTRRYSLAPVGRSYDGHPWEAVAGPYPHLNYTCLPSDGLAGRHANVTDYSGLLCEVTLPELDWNQEYALTTFHHTRSTRDTVARFLERATFGPRRIDIDNVTLWGDIINSGIETDGDGDADGDGTFPSPPSSDGALGPKFAAWVRSQMREIAPTLHRSYYRSRTSPRYAHSSPLGRPRHPCDAVESPEAGTETSEGEGDASTAEGGKGSGSGNGGGGSKWRTFAFTSRDRRSYVEFMPRIASAFVDGTWKSGPLVLHVDGYVRTITDDFAFDDDDDDGEGGVDLSARYWVCETPQNYVGGDLHLRKGDDGDDDDNGKCRAVRDGNPRVRMEEDVLSKAVGVAVLDLPPRGEELRLADPAREAGIWTATRQLLSAGQQEAACGSIPAGGGDAPVFGRFPMEARSDGDDSAVRYAYLLHDPRLLLRSNTPASPLSDGGDSARLATGGSVLCSNVPRTFLNAAECRLSKEDSACSYRGVNEDVTVRLSKAGLKRLHRATGRYVYAIDGLRAEDDGDVSGPCVPGTKSRWAPVDLGDYEGSDSAGCAGDAGNDEGQGSVLHPDTVAVLSKLLSESSDKNEHVRDITFPDDKTCDETDLETVGMLVPTPAAEGDDDGSPSCWRHVHPHHLSVYDLTHWSRADAHPGNKVLLDAGRPNPIEAPARDSKAILNYPASHPLSRWSTHVPDFTYVGRLGDDVDFRDLPDALRSDGVALEFGDGGGANATAGGAADEATGVMVCGSPGETSNAILSTPADDADFGFDASVDRDADLFSREEYTDQRKDVWITLVLSSTDQFRQRAAWALSQIFAVSPAAIGPRDLTEIFLAYYDIFVRNAFETYGAVLREVAYSPLMAEMLTYFQSKSASYVYEKDDRRGVFADENMAREVMQLFTTGLIRLRLDGTPEFNQRGYEIPVYGNADIQSFARAWTGFDRQRKRGNVEDYTSGSNRIDPMRIVPQWRDPFPKTDLSGDGFVGDGYPLCFDAADAEAASSSSAGRAFLRRGARYVLLGGTALPETQWDPPEWDGPSVDRLVLDPDSSELHGELCQLSDVDGACSYPNEVTLDRDLPCHGSECSVDSVRTVRVQSPAGSVYYEYVRRPCVRLAFYSDGRKISGRNANYGMCAHPRDADAAYEACCPPDADAVGERVFRSCIYAGERLSYLSARRRCAEYSRSAMGIAAGNGEDSNDGEGGGNYTLCDFGRVSMSTCGGCCTASGRHWTNAPCRIQAKVDYRGWVAIVHAPDGMEEREAKVRSWVRDDNENYFRVYWEGDGAYPRASDGCGSGGRDIDGTRSPMCRVVDRGAACLCDVDVLEEVVFDDASALPATAQDVLDALRVGGVEPDAAFAKFESNVEGVVVHAKSSGGGVLDSDSIFQVTNDYGETRFLRNIRSVVRISRSSDGSASVFSFRNPPHFMNLADLTASRDAHHETDAVLDIYLHHASTAPFVSRLLIQRLGGISNPSPRFVRLVAESFRTGTYRFDSGGEESLYRFVSEDEMVVFGDGRYGDLEAVFAAILLDRESCSVVLDADPSHGSMREPLVKVLSFLRAMEYAPDRGADALVKFRADVGASLGQMAHEIPTVFSFFLPDYAPPGPVSAAALVSPESQPLAMPTIIAGGNGVLSLIKYGLTWCERGLGRRDALSKRCSRRLSEGDYSTSSGRLRFKPKGKGAEAVVDELATLLTTGRLSEENRMILRDMYKHQEQGEGETAALRLAQQLISTTSEFHATGLVRKSRASRRSVSTAQSSCRRPKVLVYLFFAGAMDTHNVLVPHSGCSRTDDDSDEEEGTQGDLYQEYRSIRDLVALDKDDLLPIYATNGTTNQQPCDTFGLHPRLSTLRDLYSEGSALFLANTGVLSKPVTKATHSSETKTRLYSHDDMQRETRRLDPFQDATGTGVLGRLNDALRKDGFSVGAFSVDGATSEALVGENGVSSSTTVYKDDIESFDPKPSSEQTRVAIEYLNEATVVQSGVFGETWSSLLRQSLISNGVMRKTLEETEVGLFPRSGIGRQLEVVSRLVATRRCRGNDRDIFYVEMGGFDHHSDMLDELEEKLEDIDAALRAFVSEMKSQGEWDNVALVAASEFGRTLSPNSGRGTDHAWAGNYFVLGGQVNGSQILGEYPSDLTEKGELMLGRGRLIPTTSWDAVWNGVAQWFGIEDEASLDNVLPNRNNFEGELFTADDLFVGWKGDNFTCARDNADLKCDFVEDSPDPSEESGAGTSGVVIFFWLIALVGLSAITTWLWRRK